jgi:abortive infection bacteriophage resistance protein
MAEIKAATTYNQQLQILSDRGVVIDDPDKCRHILQNINYYRFTAYFLPFKLSDKQYIPGTSMLRVYRIYEFDRKLRRLLFSPLEEVEVYFRARLSYLHAHKYGPVGYLDSSNYRPKHNHQRFTEKLDNEVNSNKNVLFVQHHLMKYGGVFPIWAAMELFTFGMLSYFYADMRAADQKEIAKALNTTSDNIRSWLICCSSLRNICAHYGRLYYRVFASVPANIPDIDGSTKRLFGYIQTLRALYPDANKWNTEFLPALNTLISEYFNSIELKHIAFPPNWLELLKK